MASSFMKGEGILQGQNQTSYELRIKLLSESDYMQGL